MDVHKLKDKFNLLFNNRPITVRSPGRINMIGEHTDYNMGFVLPASIDKEIVIVIANNGSKRCNIYANNLDQMFSFDLNELIISDLIWPNYIQGVISEFLKLNCSIEGFDCVFEGNIPLGAGLSSSAALECSFSFAINELNNLNFNKIELVKLAQNAENNFVNVKCGIMDQFASIFGKKNHAIRLDCRSLEHEYIKISFSKYTLILIDTLVKHSLADTEYNTRRNECEQGVKILKNYDSSIHSLRDVSIDFLTEHQNEIQPLIFKRCKFVIEENKRLLDGCNDLQYNDIAKFGKKMYDSHKGLKNLYEVSCFELDLLVDIALKSNRVIGSRMMGGGFGGCTINIIENDYLETFIDNTAKTYSQKVGNAPLFYKVSITDGTNVIED